MIDHKRLEFGLNIATTLVAASVVVALAMLIWRLAGAPGARPSPPVARSALATRAALDLTPILRAAPFGAVNTAPTSATGGGLVLRGVVLARPQSASSALIAAPGGKVRTVYIGQDAGDGSILESVTETSATLRAGAGPRLLTFGKAVDRSGVAAILAGMPPSITGLAPMAAPAPAPSPPPPPPPSTPAASVR